MIKKAFWISMTNPGFAFTMLRFAKHFGTANKIRESYENQGIMVPPFIIMSITHQCNLYCTGCYAKELHPPKGEELNKIEWERILEEAEALGVSFVVVLGGEPFCRKDFFDITGKFPNLIFMVFTNGTLLDEEKVMLIKNRKNIVPMLSVEGKELDTDARRGSGVFMKCNKAASLFKKHGVFYGASITACKTNYDASTDPQFIEELYAMKCKVFFYIEYLPAQCGTESLALDKTQKQALKQFVGTMRKKHNAIFFDFPGDEYDLGICLSAGRGFVHISAEGDVEPCPFSPFSDCNLRDKSFLASLKSNLFDKIRKMPKDRCNTKGNCALFENRTWVAAQV